MKFHTGYLPPKHFEIEEDIYGHKKRERVAENEIKRIDTALAVVDEYVPKTQFTIDETEFEKITVEVRETLQDLSKKQETILDGLSKYISEKYHLRKQLDLLNEAIREYEDDYIFSVENIDGDSLECPLCGTHHDNTIINKAEILADKKQLERQSNALKKRLSSVEREVSELNGELESIRNEMNYINNKYALQDSEGKTSSLSDIVDSLASKAVQKSVNNTKDQKQLLSKQARDAQKNLKKQQGALLTKKAKEDRNNYFMNQLESHINELSATGINMSNVKSPTDYRKLFRDGGAAESTRAILAYQAAVMDMINFYGTEVLAPFIVDTPRQQEQNDLNYESMIRLVLNQLPNEQQVFLCALDDPLVKPFKDKAQVIYLNEAEKLLSANYYNELRAELNNAINAR